MSEGVNQWELFGLDMRSFGRYWSRAWEEFLFSQESPVRRRLDEPVELRDGDDLMLVRNGKPMAAAQNAELHGGGDAPCRAFLIPDDLVLTRVIRVPLTALAELESVVALELSALSPFPADDTVSGRLEVARDENSAQIALTVCSKLALRRWFHNEADQHQVAREGVELWARSGEHFIVIDENGESQRERLYRRRLWKVGAVTGGIMLALLVSVSLYSLQQKVALARVAEVAERYTETTRSAVRARDQLVSANETIVSAVDVQRRYPNPHLEIARLTGLLADDTFLTHFSSRGMELRIRGRSVDAAQVMQNLADDPNYESVEALGPITSVGNTGLEQFNLKISVAAEAAGDRARDNAEQSRLASVGAGL